MLELKTFLAGMITLQKVYVDWKFDVKDETQVKIWYAAFRNLTDDQFKWLVKEYYTNNDQPPKCIKNLTDILVNRTISCAKIKPEKALDFTREVISSHGGWEYEGRAEIYAELKKYPPLYQTVKEFESSIRNMSANDTYTADRFRRAYEENLRKYATEYTNNKLGLALPENKTKSLPNSLPYEE